MPAGFRIDLEMAIALSALPACSSLAKPPPGWFKEPIAPVHFCAGEPPSSTAKRPTESLERALARISDIERCHNELLDRNPKAFGTMDVRFLITARGTVTKACITEATLDDSPMAACVLRAVEAMVLEPASGEEVVELPLWFDLKANPAHTEFPYAPRRTTHEEQDFRRDGSTY